MTSASTPDFDPLAGSKFAAAVQDIHSGPSALVKLFTDLKPALAAMDAQEQTTSLKQMHSDGMKILLDQESKYINRFINRDEDRKGMFKPEPAMTVMKAAQTAGLLIQVVSLSAFVAGMTDRDDAKPMRMSKP